MARVQRWRDPSRSSPSGRAAAPPVAQPFLKWVGGKAQLLAQFAHFFPEQVDRYIEPFIGGGAVFFHLKRRFPHLRAVLRDNNDELINTYRVVRDAPEALMQRLDEHLARYHEDCRGYYYRVRKAELLATDGVERAARMIFLNKTCFNGLWRVNLRGRFNAPIGTHPRQSLYDRDSLLASSHALAGSDLATQDFRATFAEVQPGDFVYVDPPYIPASATARFTSYTKEDFGLAEQRELAALALAAAARGTRLMLSNSDTALAGELYAGCELHRVSARRAVNRVGSKRGMVQELVALLGYPERVAAPAELATVAVV